MFNFIWGGFLKPKKQQKSYVVKVSPKLTPCGFLICFRENSEHSTVKWRHITNKVLVFHLKVC